jgi:apolipoprotein N-acyltransferase
MAETSRISRLWPWLAAVLSGLLLVLCFPPFDLGGVAFVALAPLLAAVWLKRPARRAGWYWFRLGYVTGLVFFTGTFYWLGSLGPLFDTFFLRMLPFFLALYLALFVAVWAWFAGWFAGRHFTNMRPLDPLEPLPERPPLLLSTRNLALSVAVAAGWTALEWLRNCGDLSFGWNPLGVALHADLTLIQIAEFTGVAGLSFLLVLCNAIGLITILRLRAEIGRARLRPHFDFTLTMALVVGTFSFGVQKSFRGNKEAEANVATLRVALVQPNVAQRLKLSATLENDVNERILANLLALHEEAMEPNLKEVEQFLNASGGDMAAKLKMADDLKTLLKPQLVVWPEAGIPGGLMGDPVTSKAMRAVANATPALLVGTDDFFRNHNSAAFLRPGGPELGAWGPVMGISSAPTVQFYDKRRLVPFGEFLPLRPLLGWALGDLVPGDFAPGERAGVFQMPDSPIRIGPSICFEDTAARLTREPVLRGGNLGADLLVNVTNDGWFGLTAGAEQHLLNAVFRAVENRRPLLRCTNTGMTCFIDATGRVLRHGQNPTGAETDQWPSAFEEGVAKLKLKIPVNQPNTFYTEHGDVFAASCAGLTGLCVVGGILLRRGRKRAVAAN